jgi:hypothetical protein
MDFEKLNIAINLCLYYSKDRVMDILVNREDLTP